MKPMNAIRARYSVIEHSLDNFKPLFIFSRWCNFCSNLSLAKASTKNLVWTWSLRAKKERKNEEVERTLCLYCSLWSEVLLLSVCLAPQLPPHVDRRGNYCCKALPSNLFKQLNVLSLLLSLKQTPMRALSLSHRHTHTHTRTLSLCKA